MTSTAHVRPSTSWSSAPGSPGCTACTISAGSGFGAGSTSGRRRRRHRYWNRYPGARCDIEVAEYSYSFSEELQQEWEWSERYAAQPEILRYLNHVTDRFDLRRDIQFDTPVRSAVFDEPSGQWELRTAAGEGVRARYCVMGLGFLSAGYLPDIPGLRDFGGELYHTGSWPHEDVDFAGKRVGIIGAGASGIQAIPVVADEAEHLFVFQRTAQYSIPAWNRAYDDEEMSRIKAGYAQMSGCLGHRRRSDLRPAGPPHPHSTGGPGRGVAGADLGPWRVPHDRELLERRLRRSRQRASGEFVKKKIRARVREEDVADKLTPTYPFAAKRLWLDTEYYEITTGRT